ncbi:hypothetical protein K437DRAFT_293344 [Tilletiaria anomala UBC 951]|uniref:C3H1-type domain-containing protein n=1 Tax=Tilletiaria anomala (strain ATCC 24038 / CBS 436.72 / UBC 951) TaxID=1037660 RepID=A0A066WLU9_TILAU|nr:uncharacterized protein K437DRAFT_293344 [Tilletiaria anomala UBC 951]KDN51964.1 hypothetical protein K437DRAFT_293344 [Tilletiaria anomala UBC 951]
MVVCQYWKRGQCRFGNQCFNDHFENGSNASPVAGGDGGSGTRPPAIFGQPAFGGSNTPGGRGRASAFGNMSASFNGSNNNGSAASMSANFANAAPGGLAIPSTRPGQIALTADGIREEALPANRPVWRLSMFGPAKYEPNLVAGMDVSQEEMRLKAYEANKLGPQAQSAYASEEASLAAQIDQTLQQIATNPQTALQQAEKNRPQDTPTASAFGARAAGAVAPASAFAGTSSGTSAFGQPSAFSTSAAKTTGSAFGQTSAFGKPTAFGSSSAFGAQQPSTSAFGQPSAFGQTSAFGESAGAQPESAFGQPSGLSSSAVQPASAFGSTGAFGAQAPKPSFGSTSTFGASSAFGSQQSASQSAFGSTQVFGTQAQDPGTTTAFGQPATGLSGSAFGQTSAFGAPQQNSSSAFGQQSAFAAAAGPGAAHAQQPISAFGPSAFGTGSSGSAFGLQSAQSSAFGLSTQPSAFGAFGTRTDAVGTSSAFGSAFGAGVNTATVIEGADLFSHFAPKEEDLPAEALTAFKADAFAWGEIPVAEPPISVR